MCKRDRNYGIALTEIREKSSFSSHLLFRREGQRKTGFMSVSYTHLAVLDINCHRVIHKSADRFHCFLNIAVISCPVACDDQRIFALLLLDVYKRQTLYTGVKMLRRNSRNS